MRRVALVLTDGLRPDAVTPGTMPTLHALGRAYTRAINARTVRPSATIAALASLATGVGPRTHGLIEPGLGFLAHLGRLSPLGRELHRRGLAAAVVTSQIATAARPIAATLIKAAGITRLLGHGHRASETAVAAREVVDETAAGLIFVYLPDGDRAGHAHGWMSGPYLEAAAELDSAIATVADGLDDDTVLIVVADHGGGGVRPTEHDDPHPANDHVPLIFAGARVCRERVMAEPVSLLDLPPTLLWTLGVPVPASYEGRVLRSVFQHARPTGRARQVVA